MLPALSGGSFEGHSLICDCKINLLILCAEISPVIVTPTPAVTHTFVLTGLLTYKLRLAVFFARSL